MKFEWSEQKNRKNIRRHGIDFNDAIEVFRHPMLISLDDRKEYGEDRWIGIGLMRNSVIVVVYLEWDDLEGIRIISARKALRYERQKYEEKIRY